MKEPGPGEEWKGKKEMRERMGRNKKRKCKEGMRTEKKGWEG